MIGKQMSALLLEKKTLEFYKVRRMFEDVMQSLCVKMDLIHRVASVSFSGMVISMKSRRASKKASRKWLLLGRKKRGMNVLLLLQMPSGVEAGSMPTSAVVLHRTKRLVSPALCAPQLRRRHTYSKGFSHLTPSIGPNSTSGQTSTNTTNIHCINKPRLQLSPPACCNL